MKRIFLMTMAFLMALGAFDLATSREAQAQVSLELVGKLGGESHWVRAECRRRSTLRCPRSFFEQLRRRPQLQLDDVKPARRCQTHAAGFRRPKQT